MHVTDAFSDENPDPVMYNSIARTIQEAISFPADVKEMTVYYFNKTDDEENSGDNQNISGSIYTETPKTFSEGDIKYNLYDIEGDFCEEWPEKLKNNDFDLVIFDWSTVRFLAPWGPGVGIDNPFKYENFCLEVLQALRIGGFFFCDEVEALADTWERIAVPFNTKRRFIEEFRNKESKCLRHAAHDFMVIQAADAAACTKLEKDFGVCLIENVWYTMSVCSFQDEVMFIQPKTQFNDYIGDVSHENGLDALDACQEIDLSGFILAPYHHESLHTDKTVSMCTTGSLKFEVVNYVVISEMIDSKLVNAKLEPDRSFVFVDKSTPIYELRRAIDPSHYRVLYMRTTAKEGGWTELRSNKTIGDYNIKSDEMVIRVLPSESFAEEYLVFPVADACFQAYGMELAAYIEKPNIHPKINHISANVAAWQVPYDTDDEEE